MTKPTQDKETLRELLRGRYAKVMVSIPTWFAAIKRCGTPICQQPTQQ